MNDLVLAAGERVELLQHVGDGLDYVLPHLLYADVPDGAGSVAHLQSNGGETMPSFRSCETSAMYSNTYEFQTTHRLLVTA